MKAIEADWLTRSGLRAVILRQDMGHLCGYVAVPQGHLLHGKGYSVPVPELADLPDDTPIGDRGAIALMCAAGSRDRWKAPDVYFDVHGSITFAGGGDDYPVPDASGAWWFGFDCAHAGDWSKYSPEGHMWSVAEVREECERLADQLAAVAPVRDEATR